MQSMWWSVLYEIFFLFFFNDTATTEIYTLSLHDALPILTPKVSNFPGARVSVVNPPAFGGAGGFGQPIQFVLGRSEEHTSELQSRQYLVCRLLLEKKKKNYNAIDQYHSSKPYSTI